MSERMSELLWQAGGYTKLDGSYSLHESHLQKFAELIVKECVQMFAENGYDESCDMLIEHWDIDPRTFRS
jgi:hypothetical protein